LHGWWYTVSQPCDNEFVQTKADRCWQSMGEAGWCSKKARTAQVQKELFHSDFWGFESTHGRHALGCVDDG
jgi:hypothetical protein